MKYNKILRLIAFIFSLVSTIVCGILLIPLIWMIPLTVKLFKAYKNDAPLTTGYVACMFVFVSRIAAILLIIDNGREALKNKKLLIYIAYVIAYLAAVSQVFLIIPCFYTFAVAFTFERLYEEDVDVKLPTKVALVIFAPFVSTVLLLINEQRGRGTIILNKEERAKLTTLQKVANIFLIIGGVMSLLLRSRVALIINLSAISYLNGLQGKSRNRELVLPIVTLLGSLVAGILLIVDYAQNRKEEGARVISNYTSETLNFLAMIYLILGMKALLPLVFSIIAFVYFTKIYNQNKKRNLVIPILVTLFGNIPAGLVLIFDYIAYKTHLIEPEDKVEGKFIKFGEVENYNPVLLLKDSKMVQRASGFKMWFVNNNILVLLTKLGGLLAKLFKSIGKFFKDLVLTFINGSWKTRISYYIMGFGSFARGQWLRGLLFSGFQIIFIIYMCVFGGRYLAQLGSLGDYYNSYTTPDGTVMWYDNSFNIMLYGVLTLFFIAAFLVTWYINIKQNRVNDQIEADIRVVEHHKYFADVKKRQSNPLIDVAKVFLALHVFFGFIFVVPAFFASMLYRELEKEDNSKLERIIYAIMTLALSSKVAGILMLIDAFISKDYKEEKSLAILGEIGKYRLEIKALLGFDLIVPLIVSGIAFSKFGKKTTDKTGRIVASIMSMVFVDIFGGALMLIDALTRKYEPVVESDTKSFKKIETTGDDLRAMVDKNFHTTLLALPTLGITIFTVLPIFFMILVAFTNYDGNHDPMAGKLFGWVGFQNFGKLLTWTGGDGSQFAMTFGQILLWTLVWAFFATFTNYFIGMLIAMLINKKGIKLKKLWRTILVFSIAVPQFISLMFVSNMFSDAGIFNTLYINIMTNIFHATNVTPIPFWTDPWLARITVVVINVWIGVPYLMLVVTGILMNIPADLYESANIDGANPIQQYTKITLPYMLFITGPYLLTSFTGNMNNFNVIYLLTGGGPTSQALSDGEGHYAGSTDLLITWLFSLASTDSNYKLASVIGIMVFIVVSVLSLVVYNLIPSTRNEEEFQ